MILIHVNGERITPAYAGKSSSLGSYPPSTRDHPRVCGEKQKTPPWGVEKGGSPPRVRGKAASDALSARYQQDHPRVCGEKFAQDVQQDYQIGSPPRVRGKAVRGRKRHSRGGITPACAGKSGQFVRFAADGRDHPRVCGEKPAFASGSQHFLGSPPRVRGKVVLDLQAVKDSGITPACAGKRRRSERAQFKRRDHPRVCGEKARTLIVQDEPQGSPPRVRGKAKKRHLGGWKKGDHPRVCGEKFTCFAHRSTLPGSPPRVRGKDYVAIASYSLAGITPACAGKSLTIQKMTTRSRDHPRVCGEKTVQCAGALKDLGSPPRVRGKVTGYFGVVIRIRITPACAGKSAFPESEGNAVRDHPRVCGEKNFQYLIR